MSDSLLPCGLWPTRLLHPWESPGKHTGVGCRFLLQGIFLTKGSTPGLDPRSPALQADTLTSEPPGKPMGTQIITIYRELSINEKSWKTSRKDFLQLKRQGSSQSETWYSQDQYPQVDHPQIRGQLQLQTFSPGSEWSEPHVEIPRAEALHWGKMSPQNVWLWKSLGLTCGRARELWGIETPLFKIFLNFIY